MTFYVQKSLAHGPIRFGVSPRVAVEDIDSDAEFSTGASGDFLKRRTQGFFFADTRPIDAPELPVAPLISRTPYWQSLRGEGYVGIGYIALMILGAILVLLGFAVVAKKGAAGWVEVILGAAMIATPIVITTQRRRLLAAQEEKDRAEREERERRNRAMLDAYIEALKRVREDQSDANLREATRQRELFDLPYEIWSPVAKRTVLDIGFDALSKLTLARAKDVAELMSRVSRAVGLTDEDATAVKVDLYRALVWHLLADDRLGKTQSDQLKRLREGFGIDEAETEVIEEFRKLCGVDRNHVPKIQCAIKLGFREYCIHSTRGTLLDERGRARGTGSLFVTNKRVFIDVKRPIEIPHVQLDDVEVDVDANRLIIRAAEPKKPVIMQVERPIYTAALIDIAATIDERPKGFAMVS